MVRTRRPSPSTIGTIAATPALRERAVAKEARLVEMLATALSARGVDEDLAVLAAQTGWATLAQAMRRWRADPSDGLEAHVERAWEQLRTVVAELD